MLIQYIYRLTTIVLYTVNVFLKKCCYSFGVAVNTIITRALVILTVIIATVMCDQKVKV